MKDNKIGVFKMVSFLLCGIIVLDTFVAPAALGIASITLWALVAIFFTIPNGLINAELGAAYPQEGGIYVWIKEALGEKHATVAGWFYWVNVGIWMPAVFIAFATWFGYTFVPDMGTIPSMIIALTVCWAIVGVVIRGVDLGVLAANIAAIIKVAVLLIFGSLGIVYAVQNGTANDFGDLQNWIPTLSDLGTLSFVSAIVFNLLGFELIASIVNQLRNPKKDVPTATIIAAVLIAALYIFGTFGVLVATPASAIDPLDGFYLAMKELTTVFGTYQPVLFKIIMAGTLYTLVANMISWIIGASEVLGDVDFAKYSKILSYKHPKYGTRSGSYILLGVIASFLIVTNYSLAGDANEAFWNILAFSMVIFLIPYIYLGPALVILRKRDGEENRPYLLPGGRVGMWASAVLNTAFVGLSVALLFFTGEWNTFYHLTMIIGVSITTAVGFILYYRAARAKRGVEPLPVQHSALLPRSKTV